MNDRTRATGVTGDASCHGRRSLRGLFNMQCRAPRQEPPNWAGGAGTVTRICLLTLTRRSLSWARHSITGRSVRPISQVVGPRSWLVALAESAGISASDVIGGACTLQVLQGQLRLRHGMRNLTAFPGDLIAVPDAAVWLSAITDCAVILTGAAADDAVTGASTVRSDCLTE